MDSSSPWYRNRLVEALSGSGYSRPVDLETLTGGFLLAAAAWLTATAAARWAGLLRPATQTSRSEFYLQAGVVAAFFTVAPTAVLGLIGHLNVASLMLTAVVLHVVSRRLSMPRFQAKDGSRRWRSLRLVALFSTLPAALDLLTRWPSPPVAWDAMTYHLYLPARWLQEGRLFHVPTVFSDNAAAFAPQNGALFFAWQMALSRRDATINVSQFFCLLLLALALYRLSRHLGVSREPAALAALTLLWLEPLRRLTFSANVDVFMIAFWLASLYWLLLALRRPSLGTISAAGLAAGLAAGTKTIGLPLVVLSTLVPMLWGSPAEAPETPDRRAPGRETSLPPPSSLAPPSLEVVGGPYITPGTPPIPCFPSTSG